MDLKDSKSNERLWNYTRNDPKWTAVYKIYLHSFPAGNFNVEILLKFVIN